MLKKVTAPIILITASHSPSLCNFRGALIERLRTNGEVVHAAAPGLMSDAPTRDWLTGHGVVCHDAPFSRTGLDPISDLRALWALTSLMRQIKPEIFLGYTIKPVIWGVLAARLAGVPQRVALITGLGYAFTGDARGKRAVLRSLIRWLYTIALRRATLVFFQNPDDQTDFARWGVLPASLPALVVNGSGVDTDAFITAPFPDAPQRFLLIARLLGDKGIREYAAAAASLKGRWPYAEWHLVGPLDSNPDAISETEVRGWHDAGHLTWHGALSDVRSALAAAHVYVLPSYREGTPRTVLEAMSMGRPVITTDTPGCRETVQDGLNGFLVPVRDTAALATAMEQFLLDQSLIPQMGAHSRAIAEERYDVHKVNAVMIDAMGLRAPTRKE